MKRAPKSLHILLVLLCFAGLLKATLPQILIGNWTTTSNLSQARSNAASVLLSDGRILIIGGDGGSGALLSAEFFGTDGTVSSAAAMNVARSRHFAVVLADGRVLVGGGTTTGGGTTNSAEVYDPSANSWTQINPLTTARANATAAPLQDGRVVIAGGDNSGAPSNTIEIYDPSTGNFSFAGTLSSPRTEHAMAVLQDGRVLIVGGFDGTNPLASSDIFDPVSGNVSAGPSLATARYAHSATTLFNGQVAVIGGVGTGANGTVDLASVELFDPTAGTFTTSGATLGTAREGHQAFLLPNNNSVVIVGGTSAGIAQATAEMFTPQVSSSNGAWTYTVAATGSMNSARVALTGSANQANGPISAVTPKPGYVIVAGGTDASSNTLNSTEAYGYPAVQTDDGDYPPGTTVNISGSGFKAGETVTITLVESPLIDTHGPYTVTADANGNFSDSSFVTDSHDENVRFFLSVVGSQSGAQAQNTFTDSKPNTVTVGPQQTNPVAPGGSTQYTVTVGFNGNGGSCTSPLSVNSALPTGATASFNPSSVTSTGNANPTLTISTTSSTPPGSTNFTVLAGDGTGCQSGTATGSGTLVVVENTTTSLATSLTPSTFGQSITLTATVAKVTGPTTPTGGTVTFLDGTTQIGTVTLSNGTATLQTSTLTAGSHSLTASYAGVTNSFGASASSAVNQTVNEASTTTTVSSASGTAGQGSVTLNANVTANSPSTAAVNEGTVTFTVKQGATTIGTVTSGTVTGGAASANFSLTSVSAGSYSISATYNPATTNPNFTTSIAATPGTLTVNATSTTTTVASSANPSGFGQSVTFTARIAPASGTATPTGTVQFVVDGSNFGTPVNVASCSPSPDACATSISTSTLSVGSHSVVANYSGDGNYSASSSSTLTHTVNQASTTTGLTSSTNPSVFGQSVTFTASVTVSSPGSGTIPAGETVTFKDGTSTLGTGTTNASGVATFTTSSLGVATHSVTAVYAGDTNFATSTSNTVSQVVNKAGTTTSITSDLSTSTVVGQAYSIAASVASTSPGAGTIPNGDTVTVSDGTATCTITLSSAAGSCNLTSTTAGAKTITATYNGDPNFNTSASAGVAHTVNKASTTTTISSNTPNPSTVSQAVTINYSVSVNLTGAGTPTGNVIVSDGVGDSCSASVAAGSCQITFNTAGSKTLTATYGGDANFNTSASSTANQTVNPKLAFTSPVFATLTGLCSPQISVQIQNANGSAATLTTATVLNPSSSSGTAKFFSDAACSTQINSITISTGASTGNVFYEDGTVGTPTITVASTGLASVSQTEAITGLRFGSTAFNASVNACSPAITLQSANTQGGNPTSLTQTTTINLSSSSAGGKFYSDAACTTQITSTTIGSNTDAGHDSPSFFYKDASAGTPNLTGSAGTASATQAETITKLTPTFTVPASQSITFGTASITLSGTIASGTNFPPSGETVNITINSVTTPATIGNNGAFSAIIETHAIPASATPYMITYSYAGDNNFTSATNTATTLTVNKGTTSTSLASSQNPAFSSQQVTFTATVSLTTGNGIPTGAVQFQDAGVNLGTAVTLTNNGGVFTATFQTSSLSVGTHNVTAVYSGDNNFSGSISNTVSQVVNNPATTTTVSASLNPSTFGQSVIFSVTVTSQAGTPTGSMTLYDGACGSNPISGSIALNSGGQASFTTSALSAGSHTIFACYTPTGVFLASSNSVVQIVNKATATISVTPYAVTYDGMPHTATGTATGVGGVDLSADLNLSGTTHTNAGDYPGDAWSFTDPTGNYNSASGTVHDAIGKATAQITVTPYNLTYDGNPHTATGTATGVGGIDLTADLNLTGTTHTNAGTYTDTWTFTDPTANYNAASNTIQDVINPVLVTITLSNLTQTYDGTPKAVYFIASPNLGGVVVTYTGLSVAYPASPNPPTTAGTYSVTASTTDPNFAGNASATLTINKATPIINWSNPADITYGTALGSTQLNATATFNNNPVTGTFTYNPPAGTVLPSGNAQTLSTDFAPDDSIDFNAVMGTTVLINVKADPLYVISSDGSRPFGASNPTFTATLEGLVNGDTASSIGNPSCTSTANSSSTPGTYGAVCSGVTSTNYNVTYVNGTLTITNPLNTITVVKDKNGDSGSETLQIGQTDVLTAFGQFADSNTRALASAGGTSFSRADLTTPVFGAALAEAGGMLYAIGGTDASNTVQKIVQAYNPKTNTWSTISAQLATARTNAAAASVAGRIYVIGGSDGNNPLASIEVLDTTSGTPAISSFSGSLGLARSNAAAAVWNQKLYIVGGTSSSAQSTVDVFDLVLGTSSTSDAGTSFDQASAAVLNNKLYVLGTSSGSVDAISFDGTTWSSPSTTSLDASKGVGVTAFNNQIYSVNGTSLWSYNGTSFAQESNPLGNEHDTVQPVALGSRLYVASAGSGMTNSKLDAFAPDEVNWTTADNTKATIDNAGNLAAVGRTDPNSVTLTATSLASSSITGSFQLTVIRKTQTINFGALSNRTYGDADFLISAASVNSSNNPTNLLVSFTSGSGDSCTVGASTLSGGTSSATVHITGTGSCTITAAQPGDDATWSPAPSVSQKFSIAPATLTAAITGDPTKPYDGTTAATLTPANFSLTGLVGTDSITVSKTTGTYNSKDVTTANTITVTLAATDFTPVGSTLSSNYTLPTTASGAGQITPKTLTAALIGNPTKPYDGTTASTLTPANFALTGLVTGESITVTQTVGTYNSKDVVTANTVTASLSASNFTAGYATLLSNYSLPTTASGAGQITPRLITATADPQTKVYGSADPTLTYQITSGSLVSGDSFSGSLTRASGENVGTYAIQEGTLALTSNYTLTYTGANLSITPATLVVAANPQSKIYGQSDPTLTYSATGFQFTDNAATVLTGSLTRAAGETVAGGPYAISQGSLTSNANYKISFSGNNLTITPATLMVNANPQSKVYGQSDPPLTFAATGFQFSDTAASVLMGALTRVPGETGPGSPYAIIQGTLTANANYKINFTPSALTITPAPLTITASSGVMTYGTSPVVVTPIYAGFVNGDGPNSLTPPPTCAPVFSSSTPAGSYITSCTGAADPNYAITPVYGNVIVNQAATIASVVSSSPNNTSTFMQLVAFTATVADNSAGSTGTPTGTVTFYNGNSAFGTVALSLVGGQDVASLSTTALPATSNGTFDTITAVYGGDNNFTASSSPALQQTVQPAPILSLNPTALSFGNTNVGTTSTGQSVTLINVGDAPLTLGTGSISVTGPNAGDFITTSNCGSNLGYASGSNTCIITVKFKPSETGVEVGTLQITDNDDDSIGAQQFVSLTGSGLSTIAGTSLYTDAIFATSNGCGALTLSGGSSVDSFNSSLGYSASDASGGNVGTNGNITLSGSNSAIHGAAFVDSTTSGSCSKSVVTGFTSNGGAQVTGGLIPLNGPITYPAPPAANPVPPTTTQNITSCPSGMTGCTNISSKVVSLGPGQYGNVSISGGTTAHVSQGTYNLNSLNLSGKSILYVDSGPVVVNIAGSSLSSGAAAMDVTGGSIQNPTHIPTNLQFAYGGSHGVNLSGGSDSYAVVYAPNALINMSGGSDFFGSVIGSTVTSSGGTNVHYDSKLPNIQVGNYIWFTAVVNNVSGLPSNQQVKLYLTNSSISFTTNGNTYNVPVANSVVTFNSASQSSGAKTGYDLTNNRWSTSVAKTGLTGNTFVAGVAFQVPAGGFPTGIQNVTWSASYSTDTPGVTLQWQWAAGVFTSFSTTYANSATSNVLGVNAEDGSGNAYGTDPAGTPESYKQFASFGATGGYFSAASGVVPTVAQMSVSPSSLSFGLQNVGTTSGQQIAVLTNNYTSSFTVSGVSVAGTNAADFVLLPNGPGTPNNCLAITSLASGTSCTLYATFTPSLPDFESAKIAITDGANNSPQTVFLTGTGQ